MSDIDLSAPEVKKAIDAAVKAAVSAAVEEATAPLISKRDELLGEVRKLKKGAEIKPEDVEALEKEIESLKGDKSKLEKENKTFKTEFEKAQGAYQSESAFTQKLLVQNGLTEAFMKAGVQDQDYIDLLVSKHSQSAKVVIDGDNRKVMFGDKDQEVFINEWKQTDAAKKVIAAPVNGGGGANGGSGNGGGGNNEKANMGGDKKARIEAINAKFPELKQT